MKIAICGSMHFAKEMLEIKNKLEKMGHNALVPSDTNDCITRPELNMDMKHCLETDVQKECFRSVAESDAILVLNYKKNGINGYVGGATLMEIGLAQHFDKKIFLLYPPAKIEEQRHSLEVQIAKPVILNGNVERIIEHI